MEALVLRMISFFWGLKRQRATRDFSRMALGSNTAKIIKIFKFSCRICCAFRFNCVILRREPRLTTIKDILSNPD